MQAWYPCFKKKKRSPSSVTVYGGGIGTVLCSSLWCSKRLLVVQSAHEEDEGHPDMSCKKNSTENNRPTDHRGAWEHIYLQILQRKKVSIHTCTEEKACLLSGEEGTSLSSINRTTGLNARLASARRHIYSTVGGHNSKGGRRRGCWAVPLK